MEDQKNCFKKERRKIDSGSLVCVVSRPAERSRIGKTISYPNIFFTAEAIPSEIPRENAREVFDPFDHKESFKQALPFLLHLPPLSLRLKARWIRADPPKVSIVLRN